MILEFLGVLGVITNCALLAFTHPTLISYFGIGNFILLTPNWSFIVAVILEVWFMRNKSNLSASSNSAQVRSFIYYSGRTE